MGTKSQKIHELSGKKYHVSHVRVCVCVREREREREREHGILERDRNA
jgi:hypothetical protein